MPPSHSFVCFTELRCFTVQLFCKVFTQCYNKRVRISQFPWLCVNLENKVTWLTSTQSQAVEIACFLLLANHKLLNKYNFSSCPIKWRTVKRAVVLLQLANEMCINSSRVIQLANRRPPFNVKSIWPIGDVPCVCLPGNSGKVKLACWQSNTFYIILRLKLGRLHETRISKTLSSH